MASGACDARLEESAAGTGLGALADVGESKGTFKLMGRVPKAGQHRSFFDSVAYLLLKPSGGQRHYFNKV